jgi:hypothetical protein
MTIITERSCGAMKMPGLAPGFFLLKRQTIGSQGLCIMLRRGNCEN